MSLDRQIYSFALAICLFVLGSLALGDIAHAQSGAKGASGTGRYFEKQTPYPILQPRKQHSHVRAGKAASIKGDVPFPRIKPFGVRDNTQRRAKSVEAVSPIKPESVKSKPIRSNRNSVKAYAHHRPAIVIDPGHGGYDPGAIGKTGTQEKRITFEAAKTLKTLLEQSGRYEVIITRNSDRYIDHEERLRIARAGGADLFISIHADSTHNRAIRGASVYTLADRAKNRSKQITNTQNWILDVDLTQQSDPVGDILIDLAQRKTESQSEQFANLLISHLKGKTRLVENSHRRAGYFVLLAPDVPAVLLELGFLSNAQDEALLKSTQHRREILNGVTRAIDQYFDQIQR